MVIDIELLKHVNHRFAGPDLEFAVGATERKVWTADDSGATRWGRHG